MFNVYNKIFNNILTVNYFFIIVVLYLAKKSSQVWTDNEPSLIRQDCVIAFREKIYMKNYCVALGKLRREILYAVR